MPNDNMGAAARDHEGGHAGPGLGRRELEGLSGLALGQHRRRKAMSGYFLSDAIGRKFIETWPRARHSELRGAQGLADSRLRRRAQPADRSRRCGQGLSGSELHHLSLGHRRRDQRLLGLADVESHSDDESDPFDPLMHTGSDHVDHVAARRPASGREQHQRLRRAGQRVEQRDERCASRAALHRQAAQVPGPDNIVWGTDCILYGSPQPQIEAFRMFTITPQFQQMYGYPALTPGDQSARSSASMPRVSSGC